jgi:hypothetical protein
MFEFYGKLNLSPGSLVHTLGEGLATESTVLQECSSTTVACLQEACNTNKLSQTAADSVANPSPRF